MASEPLIATTSRTVLNFGVFACLCLIAALERRKQECSVCYFSFEARIMSVENQLFTGRDSQNQESDFYDRRNPNMQRKSPGLERRQFSDGHASLSPDAAELGNAIDQYKLEHCRRFISYEEMLTVIKSLGYSKST